MIIWCICMSLRLNGVLCGFGVMLGSSVWYSECVVVWLGLLM